MDQNKSHIPVLYNEVIELSKPVCSFGTSLGLDCTLGQGGHTAGLLENFPGLYLMALDKDNLQRELVQEKLESEFKDRFISFGISFSEVDSIKDLEIPFSKYRQNGGLFNLIFADLGISSVQLDDPARGFSYRFDSPLDMRMDTSENLTAEVILNEWEEKSLVRLFFEGGTGSIGRKLAKEIVANRPIKSTFEFKEICISVSDKFNRKSKTKSKTHPATVPFQAIRIAVNKEFTSLLTFLKNALPMLAAGGRIIIISFHSLEDEIVTKTLRWWSSVRGKGLHPEDEPLGVLLTKKAILPSEEEVSSNSRSHSARMRVFERNENPLWKERKFLPERLEFKYC